MVVRVFAQGECNYRHLQDAIGMLPAATRELDANARPDTLRALSAMTAAVTGANPQLFFAVAEVDGVTAGFLGGAQASFLLESRTLAQDILLYVAPEHRGADVATELIRAFVEWAKVQGASEVRFFLMNSESEAALAAATSQLGFAKAGTVMSLKP
jgi:GNAT superfamily N-acetyltransferase